MENIKNRKNRQTILGAFRLSKAVIARVIEDNEIKAFSPDSKTFKEFSDVTNTIVINKLRDTISKN